MNEKEELQLLKMLQEDEAGRDRKKFDYTGDALRDGGIMPLSIWPEANENVRRVIEGEVDYDALPVDPENEFHKGGLFTEQQDIIVRNNGRQVLCEAREMRVCLAEKCPLYKSDLSPPVCREYKMAFRR